MKRRSPIHAYKRLLADDHDWDYAYLIALEKKKLQRMHDYIEHEGHIEGKELVVLTAKQIFCVCFCAKARTFCV